MSFRPLSDTFAIEASAVVRATRRAHFLVLTLSAALFSTASLQQAGDVDEAFADIRAIQSIVDEWKSSMAQQYVDSKVEKRLTSRDWRRSEQRVLHCRDGEGSVVDLRLPTARFDRPMMPGAPAVDSPWAQSPSSSQHMVANRLGKVESLEQFAGVWDAAGVNYPFLTPSGIQVDPGLYPATRRGDLVAWVEYQDEDVRRPLSCEVLENAESQARFTFVRMRLVGVSVFQPPESDLAVALCRVRKEPRPGSATFPATEGKRRVRAVEAPVQCFQVEIVLQDLIREQGGRLGRTWARGTFDEVFSSLDELVPIKSAVLSDAEEFLRSRRRSGAAVQLPFGITVSSRWVYLVGLLALAATQVFLLSQILLLRGLSHSGSEIEVSENWVGLQGHFLGRFLQSASLLLVPLASGVAALVRGESGVPTVGAFLAVVALSAASLFYVLCRR